MSYLKHSGLSLVILALSASSLSAGFLGSVGGFLGSAGGFAVLAGTTITNTGNTVIDGDIGVSPGTAITGFPPGMVTGTIRSNDGIASQAEVDLTSAYGFLAGLASDTNLSNINLGGLTLTSGVYTFDAAAALTGALTLSGSGSFIFQIGSAFNIANNSSIQTIGGANPYNIYFQIGSSGTAGTADALEGNFLALQSISLNTGTSLQGRALAINGAVTLQNNLITATPEPAAVALFGSALAVLALRKRVFAR